MVEVMKIGIRNVGWQRASRRSLELDRVSDFHVADLTGTHLRTAAADHTHSPFLSPFVLASGHDGFPSGFHRLVTITTSVCCRLVRNAARLDQDYVAPDTHAIESDHFIIWSC